MMRTTAAILALALLASCGEKPAETPDASVQRGIDRSVADVRAAEAAASAPVTQSKTIGELTHSKSAEKSSKPADKSEG